MTMTARSIEIALQDGLIEPCVVFDGEGREIRAYRPTFHAAHLFERGLLGAERKSAEIVPFRKKAGASDE